MDREDLDKAIKDAANEKELTLPEFVEKIIEVAYEEVVKFSGQTPFKQMITIVVRSTFKSLADKAIDSEVSYECDMMKSHAEKLLVDKYGYKYNELH